MYMFVPWITFQHASECCPLVFDKSPAPRVLGNNLLISSGKLQPCSPRQISLGQDVSVSVLPFWGSEELVFHFD